MYFNFNNAHIYCRDISTPLPWCVVFAAAAAAVAAVVACSSVIIAFVVGVVSPAYNIAKSSLANGMTVILPYIRWVNATPNESNTQIKLRREQKTTRRIGQS